MQLILDTDYCRQIQELPFDDTVKNQLVAMISAWQHHTMPPTASNAVLRELTTLNLTAVVFTDRERKEHYLEITKFQPHDKIQHRQFTYLRPFYPNGTNEGISKLMDTPQAGMLGNMVGSVLKYLADRGELQIPLQSIEPACRYIKPFPAPTLTVTNEAGDEFEITVREKAKVGEAVATLLKTPMGEIPE